MWPLFFSFFRASEGPARSEYFCLVVFFSWSHLFHVLLKGHLYFVGPWYVVQRDCWILLGARPLSSLKYLITLPRRNLKRTKKCWQEQMKKNVEYSLKRCMYLEEHFASFQ